MFNPEKTAETLAIILRRHGLVVEVAFSGLSKSRYLTVAAETDTMRVRVSDHVAKPTYEAINGAANYEVGNHDMAATESAVYAAAAILDRVFVQHDAALRASLGRLNAAADREAEERAKIEAIVSARDADNASVQLAFEAWAGDRLDLSGLNAKQRKRRRQSLRDRFTAETGMEWK